MQTMTFSSASTTLSTFQTVELGGYSPSVKGGVQFLRIFGTAAVTSAGDAATIELALVKDGVRIGYWEAICTTAVQTDGTDELIKVVFTEGGTSKFDLLGCDSYDIDRGGLTAPGGKAVWMIGAVSFSTVGTVTALNLTLATSKEA